ncbi:MAG: replicative DNA helicase [Ruminococcaceae bacterium]|nr:replicative DNA helicase [Oscillospiraceae bacterium]
MAATDFERVNISYSYEAEQAVLGSILKDPSCLSVVMSKGVTADYFYAPQHKAIYNAMVSLDTLGQTIDPLIVLEKLKADNVFDNFEGRNYLAQLSHAVPSVENIEGYVRVVKEKYTLRSIITVTNEILEDATTSDMEVEVLLDSAEQRIYNIRQGRSSNEPSNLLDVINNDVYDRLSALNSDDPEIRERYIGIPTGFSDLDKCISGLNKTDLVIIGARPAVGKTSFALNIALNAAYKAKKKVLFFSLEMSKGQLAQRLVGIQGRVSGLKVRSGNLSDEDWRNLAVATESFKDTHIYLDDTSNITVNEMKAKIRRLKDVDCVFVDYLQLMKSGVRIDSRAQEVAEITRSLKLMAKDLNIPVIVLAQLNREAEGVSGSRKPQLSNLRESGSIEQDADIVIFLHKEREDEGENVKDYSSPLNEISVIIAKNRHGPTDKFELNWIKDIMLFSQIEKDREAPFD